MFFAKWAKFTDYVSHRNLLIISLFLGSIVTNLFGWSARIWQVLTLRALLGAVEKMGLLENIIMGDITAEEDRPRGKSLTQANNGCL
jgi:sugar phosphate permease